MGPQGRRPGRDDHPVLHRAYADANSARGVWRARYSVPSTDPRYLDATDGQILHDLLALRYLDEARSTDDRARFLREAEEQPEAFAAQDAKVLAAFEPGGALFALTRLPKKKAPNQTFTISRRA